MANTAGTQTRKKRKEEIRWAEKGNTKKAEGRCIEVRQATGMSIAEIAMGQFVAQNPLGCLRQGTLAASYPAFFKLHAP